MNDQTRLTVSLATGPIRRRSLGGFSLVITVMLMVILGLLAVGLMSLSALSLRASSRQSALNEARANARMALTMAIGELQQQLGPDQRISMTAGQRMRRGTEGAETSAVTGNRHWTGVYDSWPATSEARPEPAFRSWLISGEPGLVSSLAAADTEIPGSEAVELVGTGTVGSAGADGLVRTPAVELVRGSDKVGRMAWWVGDQGVKAALSMPPVAEETRRAILRNQVQTAPRNAVELASSDDAKPFADVAPDDRLALVTSWPQTGHLADPAATRPLFHDLAAFSTGLLTNVRAGGFRKDLSLKMEAYDGAPDLSDPENVLYTVRSPKTGNDEVGINFQELWAYYHLYEDLQYGGGLSYTTGGSLPRNAPYLRTADSIEGVAEDDSDRFKQPITINYQVVLSFEAGPAPRDPGRRAIYVNLDPIVTLWNPLDVAVDIPTVEDKPGRESCYMYIFWQIPYDINVRINSGRERRCSLMRSIERLDFANSSNGSVDYNMLRLNAGLVERITLKPGEVLKISQTGNTQASNGGFRGLDGRKGFNYGGGTALPLLDENGEYILLEDPNRDRITYSATPNHLTSGVDGPSGGNIIDEFRQRNSRRWSLTHNSVVLGRPWGRNVHLGVVSIDYCYGYRRAQVGERRRSGRRNKTLANSERVFADAPEFSEVFPHIEGRRNTRTIPAASLINRKAPFMVHSYHIKTEEENRSGTRTFARFNPKAHNVDFYDLSGEERDMLPYEPGVTALTSWLNAPLDETTSGQGFFGSSLGAQFGSNFVNTHAVPRQPIVSLAAFQDSFANGFNRLHATIRTQHAMARLPLLPQISHAIGNSLAPAVIPPDRTTHFLDDSPHPLADHSYLANRELWDDYFLSGIAPQPRPAFPRERDQETVAREFFGEGESLPVARYLPDLGGTDAEELIDSWFSGGVPDEEAVRRVASYLRADGLFNVNSTSVEAWKAVLGGLKDRPIMVRDESGAESIAENDDKTPIANVGAPRDVFTEDASEMRPEQWYGRRILTDEEIGSLAHGIVREVRKRGPFLSLADFVNRRVGTDEELARAGAIQSALDSEEVAINEKQNEGRTVAGEVANRFAFPEAEEGARHYGAPSLVKQGDILTPIAPVLSARSDSFIIRSYGESVDDEGNVIARAWCEAVVERTRDYVDPADEPWTPAADLSGEPNRNFGRRFRIASFRWLNPGEI